MTMRALVRLFAGYFFVLSLVCAAIVARYSLHTPKDPVVLVSVWQKGVLIARAVTTTEERTPEINAALDQPGAMYVYEKVVGLSPILSFTEAAFAISLVSARDGARVTYNGKTTYVTPDELLALRGYDRGFQDDALGLLFGADVQLVIALAADRLGARASEVAAHATFARIRVQRDVPGLIPKRYIGPDELNADVVRAAIMDAAHYLARGVDSEGKFRYLVNAATNRNLPGYDWPRHSGATYFLAQAASLSHDPELVSATLRAGSMLKDRQTAKCGENACIGQDSVVDLGSASLAVVAYAQIASGGLDPSYKAQVEKLTPFIRSQQRDDGEFKHQYDKETKRPIDIQFPYYSGEATLALARAYKVTNDPRDLEAAKKGLSRIVGGAWSFFGNRYYFGEEHWTCQAMDDLWEAAPDPRALDFCLRWQQYMRRMQLGANESPHDGDGAFAFDPILTPRLTPAASRCEAGVATLDAARKSHAASDEELRALDHQLRRALALIVRQQFSPGPIHLFADPDAMRGAIPGSEVDWDIRIDYAQHAGSAMVRWLDVVGK
ncbi:MAG: hypothetical protein ABI461_23765 [Polyangiaceae bacterium]